MADKVTFTFIASTGDNNVESDAIEEELLHELITRDLESETVEWWAETVVHVRAERKQEE